MSLPNHTDIVRCQGARNHRMQFVLRTMRLELMLNAGKPVGDVTVVILDRPRHKGTVYAIPACFVNLRLLPCERKRLTAGLSTADIIQECRDVGCRIRLISDGDVAAAVEVKFSHAYCSAGIGWNSSANKTNICTHLLR